MKKIEKETLAIYLVMGLVVFGLVVFGFYTTSSGDKAQATDEQKQKAMFSAPEDLARKDKEEYKSTLDAYEETQAKENQEAEKKILQEPIGFNKTLNPSDQEKQTAERQAEIQQSAVNKTADPATNKKATQSLQNVDKKETQITTEIQPNETEPLVTKRKLVSASQREDLTSTTEKEMISVNEKTESLNEVPVVVHGDQTVLNGQRIRLRVTKNAQVGGHIIDADQILTGTCVFSSDRVNITIHSFRSEGQIVKMKLYAYDNGEMGIYATTNTNQDIANETAQQATRRVRFSIPTPLGSIPVGGGAASKKIAEQEKQFQITSQYNLTLSDKIQ